MEIDSRSCTRNFVSNDNLCVPRLRFFSLQVAHDCGLLPLALGIVGNLAREQPLDPVSWQTLHDDLQRKWAKFRQLDNGKLFSTMDMSLCNLPRAQQEELQLMAVMASGIAATPEMLANLWDQVRSRNSRRAPHVCGRAVEYPWSHDSLGSLAQSADAILFVR